MFHDLNEIIKRDEREANTSLQRSITSVGVLVVSVLLFVCLYFGIHLLGGGTRPFFHLEKPKKRAPRG